MVDVVAGNNWLGKLTAAGEITWQKTCQIPSVASFAAFSVLQTHDGGYAVAGVAPIPDNFTIIPYLLKFDAAGNLERQRAYNVSGGATSIELTADGGYIASGTAQYSGDWVSKLDANWNVEWEKSLVRSGESSLYGVQQTADGGDLASGHVDPYVPLFQRHAWLTKLDANGIIAGCASGMVADLNASQPGSAVTAVDATVDLDKKWILAGFLQNWTSFAGDGDRADTNQMNLQPVATMFFPGGWSVGYSGNILANWKESGDEVWTVPVGIAVSRMARFGRLPVKLQVAGQYMPIHPDDFGQEWNVQLSVSPVLPKLIKGTLLE